jgi:hypothetical protein
MNILIRILRNKKLKHTQRRNGSDTVVLEDTRWIFAHRFKLSKEFQQSNISDFLEFVQKMDFYYEDVNYSENKVSRMVRTHGPFTLEKITKTDYQLLTKDEMLKKIDSILRDPNFTYENEHPFPESFTIEGLNLIKSFLDHDTEILFLTKKFERTDRDCWWRYDFWAEFILRTRSKKIGVMISFGSD